MWFCDFETTTENTKHFKEHQTSIVIYGFLKNNNEHYEFFNVLDFWKIILGFKNTQIIFFHNLKFDGRYILTAIKTNPDVFKIVSFDETTQTFKVIFKHKKFKRTFELKTFMIGNDIYYIYISTKNSLIKIYCSLKILSASIQTLGKDLGIKKYLDSFEEDESFYNVEPEDVKTNEKFKTYCKRDVEILEKSFKNFEKNLNDVAYYKNPNQKFSFSNLNTASSISFKLVKNESFYKKLNSYLYMNSEKNNYFRNWYFGGYTNLNEKYRGIVLKNINGVSYDINSSYPYVMSNQLPIYETMKGGDNDIKLIVIKIFKAKIKPEYEGWYLLKNKTDISTNDNNYLQNIEKETTFYYFENEFNIIKKFYEVLDYKIIKTHYFRRGNISSYLVNNLYQAKLDAKYNNKSQMTFKIILNSLYGKFGMNYNKPFNHFSNNRFEKGDEIIINNKKHIITQILENDYTSNYLYKVKINDFVEKTNNVVIAAYITSIARSRLFKAIYDNIDNVIYTDTDSLYFKEAEYINFNNIEVDEIKLGAWKQETNYDEFLVLAPKLYSAKLKGSETLYIKSKGLDVKKLHKKYFSICDFENISNQVNYNKELVKTPTGWIIKYKPKNLLIGSNKIIYPKIYHYLSKKYKTDKKNITVLEKIDNNDFINIKFMIDTSYYEEKIENELFNNFKKQKSKQNPRT